MRALRKRGNALGVVAALAGLMVYAAVAFADNVQNDIESTPAETRTITAGQSTTVGYQVHSNGSDGCNVDTSNAATVTINVPANVTVDTDPDTVGNQNTLSFTQCGVYKNAVFSSSTVNLTGYSITVSATGGKAGNNGYNTSPATFTLIVQASALAAPTVSGAFTSSPNAAGWFNSRPTVQWTFGGGAYASLSGDCTSASGSPLSQQVPAGDTATGSISCTATNTAGFDTEVLNYKLDETKPTSSVAGFTANAVYTLGDTLPTPGCTGSDLTSLIKTGFDGVLTQTAFLTGNGVGAATFTCNGAEDNADNVQTVASASSYSVHYGGVSGIGQPINADGNSVFSQKRAVPVKFQLDGDAPDGFDVSSWTLKREAMQCGSESWTTETQDPASTTSANTGLRYDTAADQYIANATLAGTTVNKCYRFVVTLDSNQTIESPKFKVGK